MRISYSWLCEFVDVDVLGSGVKAVAEALTSVGLSVEDIQETDGDYALDIDVTTNRPDCLNHLGLARELAAQFKLRLKHPDLSPPPDGSVDVTLPAAVDIEDPNLCPRYAARVITGIAVGESPDWLKTRLQAVGQRPINNVVDITNYVMLELGQPLHAFDYEKLEENRIVVRAANFGEQIVTLDGASRQLVPTMLSICDARRPVAVAGVMGGEASEVSEETRTVLLESAYFNPSSVRSTAKSLGLRTEASFRFERGSDPEMPVKALNRLSNLILEIAGGACAGPLIDQHPAPLSRRVIPLRSERIRKIAGVSIDSDFVSDTLLRLGFGVSADGNGNWDAEVPSFRVDVEIEDDLVEEVVRHYGYDRIEATYPAASVLGSFLDTNDHEGELTRTLDGFGFMEAMNYIFTNPSAETVFWKDVPPMVAVANPLTEVGTHLRVSVLPALIHSLHRNLSHGSKDIRLYEAGKVFVPGDSEENGLQEVLRLGVIATGVFYQPFWDNFEDRFNFHHMKGIMQTLLGRLGQAVKFEAAPDAPFLHPAIAASVSANGRPVGVVGQVHPRIQEAYKFVQPVLLAEIVLEAIYQQPLTSPKYQSLARFPAVERDLSFVIDKEIEYGKILDTLKELDLPDLQDIRLIDLYRSPNLPEGKVSLAIRLVFADPNKTLKQEEVNDHTERVLSVLSSHFDVQIRS